MCPYRCVAAQVREGRCGAAQVRARSGGEAVSTPERVLLHAHAVDVGTMTKGGHFPYPVFHRPGWQALCGVGDSKRRGNSLPREGLQLCVAPYFADGCRRHAGTVEVHRENATPEAVAGCHRTTLPTRYTADTQYTILGATAPHPSGVRFGGCPSAVPACRHDPAWRNTGLRTAATPRGVAEMSASGHRAMHRIAWALPACRHDPATYQSIR